MHFISTSFIIGKKAAVSVISFIVVGRKPSPIWDRLVFNKIKAKLGGRVHFLGSGASPLSPDIMDFLKM